MGVLGHELSQAPRDGVTQERARLSHKVSKIPESEDAILSRLRVQHQGQSKVQRFTSLVGWGPQLPSSRSSGLGEAVTFG